jgi:O-antigen/teichoic acid export membrane protein
VPLIVKNPHNATSKDLLRNVYAIASIVAILYIQAVACFANELFGYIIDAKFKSGAAIIWYVCVSQLFAKWYFFNLGFAIHKKTIWFLVITLIGTAFNILFNLYAIPRYGLVGAAVATMLATFIFYSIINSASHALYPVQLRVYTFLAFVGLSGACNYCFLNTNLSFDYRAIVFVITVVLVFISYQSEIIKLIKAGYNQLVYKLKN